MTIMSALDAFRLPMIGVTTGLGGLALSYGTCVPFGDIHLDPDVISRYNGRYGCNDAACWRSMTLKANALNGFGCAFIQEMAGIAAGKYGTICTIEKEKHFWGKPKERQWWFPRYVVDSYTKEPFYQEAGWVENEDKTKEDYWYVPKSSPAKGGNPTAPTRTASYIRTQDEPSIAFGRCNKFDKTFTRSIFSTTLFRTGLYHRAGFYSIDDRGELQASWASVDEMNWEFIFETDDNGDLIDWSPPGAYTPPTP
jgi:hypothetical protein